MRVRDRVLARAARDAYLIGSVALITAILSGRLADVPAYGNDARAYWTTDLSSLYANATYSAKGAYLYSPAFAQVIWPATLLPFNAFVATIAAINLSSLYWLVGRWALVAVWFPPVFIELVAGNINLPMTAAIAAGVRYPGTWSFVILTKVTPSVGLLWFVVRRDWRSLLMALAATACIAGVSFVLSPQLWLDWISVLAGNIGAPLPNDALPIPFGARVPIAVLVVTVGAVTARPWLLPLAALLALPTIWPAYFVVLLGAFRMVRDLRGIPRSSGSAEDPR